MPQNSRQALPASTANYGMNILSVCVFWAVMLGLRWYFPHLGFMTLACLCLLAALLPLWWYDLRVSKVHLRPDSGLHAKKTTPNWSRVARKLLALFVTLGGIYGYYILIYRFFDATYLESFLALVHATWPLIILLCGVYVAEIDRRQMDPHDEYWRIGGLLMGQRGVVDGKLLAAYLRTWFVKGFFTPFVFVILVRYLESLSAFHPGKADFLTWHAHILDLLYAIDIMFAVAGYIFTCRLLDTHIRSTDPTVLGWLVCMMCYGPFHTHFGIGLLGYDDGLQWFHWFGRIPVFYYFYGAVIIFLTLVYALATVAIGYRMSNLTYRGLITSGPYRHTKHPAYLAKVMSWWLISVPFLSTQGPATAFKHTLALIVISAIYFLRAKTEENHLSNYPEYVAYANWINDHGAFRTFKKWFPGFRYSAENRKRWGSLLP